MNRFCVVSEIESEAKIFILGETKVKLEGRGASSESLLPPHLNRNESES